MYVCGYILCSLLYNLVLRVLRNYIKHVKQHGVLGIYQRAPSAGNKYRGEEPICHTHL